MHQLMLRRRFCEEMVVSSSARPLRIGEALNSRHRGLGRRLRIHLVRCVSPRRVCTAVIWLGSGRLRGNVRRARCSALAIGASRTTGRGTPPRPPWTRGMWGCSDHQDAAGPPLGRRSRVATFGSRLGTGTGTRVGRPIASLDRLARSLAPALPRRKRVYKRRAGQRAPGAKPGGRSSGRPRGREGGGRRPRDTSEENFLMLIEVEALKLETGEPPSPPRGRFAG